MTFVTLLLDILASLLTASLGILSILCATKILLFSSAVDFLGSALGVALQLLVGTLLLLVALHFVFLVYRWRSVAARFSQEGEWGKIELSPYALKEFISGILRQEVGIDHFRVRLEHMEEGIAISVRTALSPQEKVSEVGRRIQETLARRVVERTGVEVKQVSVLVRSIRPHAEERPEEGEGSDANVDER